MKKWLIKYWDDKKSKSSIESWLDRLDIDQFKSVSKELKMLEVAGNKLKLPHSKTLGKGLFELRERRYGCRVYYCFQGDQIIILLAAGDKASQRRDIKIARDRLNVIKGEGL